ncbi:hypothetical protein CONCODRAFT_61315 [Conidiobolus coronatus NRRL 28638]|uniref:Nudix hydrolase domain-containing protein n=1 Tax=Conidiobolus coronatus (strain ATCC 28846 / CBS 209.66 / NRRL 28638) TaxID=796925 RepID=A0A137NWP2_CONC2|nr:hypothetical protein CONCODRAFT_61315 [Conidiobolus coronatus NRRL 28638]|eukprot:KXN67081.1 hypothetical protein CONCODRAFT_61315 [Conidiobolus coronatus NRRL 28638]
MMIIADYKNIPSILFTVRSSNLRSHTGEVSFPGGKKDPSDINILDCALREVEEEVNIPRSNLQVLGQHNLLLPNKTGTLCVYPFISVLKTPINNINQIKFNTEEVEKVFFTPIDHLLDQKNMYWKQFRNTSFKGPVFKPQEGEKEIWGLTGFILYNCLKTLYPGKF